MPTSVEVPPVIDVLRAAVPEASLEVGSASDMPTVYVDREHLLEVCAVLRDHVDLQFAFLVETTAADYLPAVPRYEMIYHLACLGEAFQKPEGAAPPRRLRLKTRVPDDDPRVPSVTGLWPGANWPEREVFDLFGLSFDGHPDLRRILTPDGWTGSPLRKDYPVQIRKDSASWSPIQLTAEEFAENVRASRAQATRQAQNVKGN